MVEPRVLSPSTAALYPAPQPPTSLLSPSSAWSSAGRLPIIPSYTLQPPLKIFSVLTQKYVIRQKYFSHKIPQPTSVLSKMCCRVSPLVCVEDVGAGDHVSCVRDIHGYPCDFNISGSGDTFHQIRRHTLTFYLITEQVYN